LELFEQHESNVRSYCRAFPTIFDKARGSRVWSVDGREFVDFFAGAGALNYGHNEPSLKRRLIEYIEADGITHSLDMATAAKARLLEGLNEIVLAPRGMTYKVMFPGPTGTNAVESALKLARKVTGRTQVLTFTNGFHGMTLGSLAVTGNAAKRAGAGVPLSHAVFASYDGYGAEGDGLEQLGRLLEDGGSGVDLPAAAIVETVQGEGGLRAASFEWLRRLEALCRRFDMLLVVDDIQAGCGRTGPFFSFEPAGIEPDIVCLSKSIGGYGLPLALTLIRPAYDRFAAGEHNGTFRGNNLAFVTAAEALRYWRNDDLQKATEAKAKIVTRALAELAARHPELEGELRGRGLMQGLAVEGEGLAQAICTAAFERGLLVETSGPRSEVVKLLPPVVIAEPLLKRALAILADAVEAVLAARRVPSRSVA
jgi:diaminobutyrate-2-oxoglutarate transaminase